MTNPKLFQTVNGLTNPINKSDPALSVAPTGRDQLPPSELKLVNMLRTTADKVLHALPQEEKNGIIFEMLIALTRWHARFEPETGTFKWFTGPPINLKQVGDSFSAMTEVLRETLKLNQRLETLLEETKTDNEATRSMVRRVPLMLGVAVIAISFGGIAFADMSGELIKRMDETEKSAAKGKLALEAMQSEAEKSNELLHDAMNLIRQRSRVEGLKAEAESTGYSSREALAAALQLQADSISAEANAAKLTNKKPAGNTTAQLMAVKARAKRARVNVQITELDPPKN